MTTIVVSVISVYLGICIAFYFLQHFAFFRPEILPTSFQYSYSFPFEELELETVDGGSINAIYFKVPASRGVVYYLKGNSRSIKGWGKFAKDFLSNGYDFVMFDYRGFGKSKGKRTQKKLFADAQMMYEWLLERYEQDNIIVYGRSLGSGIAARIASWNKPKMLILDSPYLSFFYNVNRFMFWTPLKWILRYDIRTDVYLKSVDCPVFIIHGTSDRLIPFSQSEKLKELYPDKIALVGIDGGHHNDLQDFPEFFDTLYDLLDEKPVSNTL
jgi:fermentation-respiration switch protein FrsA (DUF1100 family)